ncbi:MAG: SusE domain-containing protein [Saprospiraceae bacterium]|nr:SusE domain-containing protein [Saprospiraceae bacterium]
MKHIFKIFLLSLTGFFLFSCSDDDQATEATLELLQEPVLSLLNNVDVTVTENNQSQQAVPLSWTAANYGILIPIDYTVQMDLVGNNFASPVDVTTTSELQYSLTGSEINQILYDWGVFPGIEAPVELRVVSSAGDNANLPGNSNPIQINATGFDPFPNTDATIFIATQFPDYTWDWRAAPSICDVADNGNYSGYLGVSSDDSHYLVPNRGEFTYFGAGDLDGVFEEGGDGIVPSSSGYYQLTVNTNTRVYSFTEINLGIIGAATPGGWGADTDLTFDAATGIWEGTMQLQPGGYKFRANDDWGIQWGQAAETGILQQGGGDLNFEAEAGEYTITVDLSSCCLRYAISNVFEFGDCPEPGDEEEEVGVEQLYMVGAIQEHYGTGQWDPTNAIPMFYNEGLATPGWEGYIKANAGQNMKFVGLQGSWDEVNAENVNFGSPGGDTNALTGDIVADGSSGAITLDEGGFWYVFIPADLSTYQFVKQQWGIIGSSTPDGWNGETDMTYNADQNQWEITQDLVDGELKFRSRSIGNATGNHNGGGADWSYNIGTDAAPHASDQGDGNFGVTAGSYSIVVSFDPQGNATVTGL